MFRIRHAGRCIALISIFHPAAKAAQGQAGTIRNFEIVSVRPNQSGELSYRIRTPAGERFTATNVTVRMLLREAFNARDFQLSGAPGWIDTERYDIAAKLDSTVENSGMISPDELRPLIEAILASRFQLRIHHVTKQLPIFSVVATGIGPRLRPHMGTPGHQTDWGRDHINALDVTIAEFCRVLETQLDKVVVDDTKISGTFDFGLTWTPDPQPTPNSQATDPSGPSLFTAIREQYGLELKSRRGAVDVIVIDYIEKPSAN